MANQQSKAEIIKFATQLCLACSVLVSTAAVVLRPLQDANVENEKKINILRAAGIAEAGKKLSSSEINSRYQQIIPVVVNFETGDLNQELDPEKYDMYEAAASDEGAALKNDPAGIKRQAKNGTAYILLEGEKVKKIVLPVQGYGLWSTMYGFTSLDMEKENPTIGALTFYAQSETAGLGAEVANPKWQVKWAGINPYNDKGEPQISVVKNKTNANEIDSIAGATLTSKGVQNLMNYWLSNNGYKKFIENVKSGKISVKDMQSKKGSV